MGPAGYKSPLLRLLDDRLVGGPSFCGELDIVAFFLKLFLVPSLFQSSITFFLLGKHKISQVFF